MLIRIPEFKNKVYCPLHVVSVSWSKTDRHGWWVNHWFVNFFRPLIGLKPKEKTWIPDEWHQYPPTVYVRYSSEDRDYIEFEMGPDGDAQAEACYQRIISEVNEFYRTTGIKKPLDGLSLL